MNIVTNGFRWFYEVLCQFLEMVQGIFVVLEVFSTVLSAEEKGLSA